MEEYREADQHRIVDTRDFNKWKNMKKMKDNKIYKLKIWKCKNLPY